MNKWLLPLAALFALGAQSKIKHLLPLPQQVEQVEGAPFALGRPVALTDPTNTKLLRDFLLAQGCTLDAAASAKVVVKVDKSLDTFDYRLAGFANEGYRLRVRPDGIDITAATEVGVIRAAQTLAQMAMGYDGTAALEAADITDFPAFKLRGFMHDVGRSFLSIETLKRHIDLLSRFKVNTFHWHLTENQAWRLEVKAYPQLTSAQHMTRFPGKFYTQAEARELEAFAAERGVVVIPEIDMPGHSEAFRRAMGFDMQTDQGVAALKTILDEVAEVFPHAPYIHIGADERDITYPRFLETMIDKVHALDRKVVVWNPIKGVNIGKLDIDMTQMWSTAGKAIAGKPNIDCRYNYTNHFDVFADLVGIYKSNIYYADRGNPDIAGTISAPWNDRKMATERDIVAQNNFYANAIASAERGWMGGGRQYVEKGGTTLPNSGEEFDAFRSWEERFLFYKSTTLAEEPVPYVRQTNVHWCITDAFPNGGNRNLALPPETEELKESYVYKGTTYRTGQATGAGIYLRHTWGATIPTYFAAPQENTTAYAWTYVYSPTAQEAGALIEFYNYGRSEKDQAPNRGMWDRYGSRLWLNDSPVAPPTFDNSGVTGITNETLLRNENFTARQPVVVSLRQGWNKVLLRLPFNPDGGQRLRKWMFTFVLTDREGRHALDGIVYSPQQIADETANVLGSLLAEARRLIAQHCGTEPGIYPLAAAAPLSAVIESIAPTLSAPLPESERKAQLQQLQAAIAAFRTSYASFPLNLPRASTPEAPHGYRLSAPLRNHYILTSQGTGQAVVGRTAHSDEAVWCFVERADGTFDIQNYMDKSFIAPTTAHNTALTTVAAAPAKGWTLSTAATPGLFIVTSGEVQFNQTNPGLGAKLYNWGGGSNTTDTGCQFLIRSVTPLPGTPTAVAPISAAPAALRMVDVSGRPAGAQAHGLLIDAKGAKHRW